MKKEKRASIYKILPVIVIAIFFVSIMCNSLKTEAASKAKLNRSKATITVGNSVTLKVKNTKKKAKWSTNNKKVATVKSTGKVKGKVTAKKQGNATITAKIGKKKYKCKVIVKAKKTDGSSGNNKNQEKDDKKKDEQPSTEDGKNESDETAKYDAGEYSINKVHSGEATFYDRVKPGAANLDYLENTFYTAAMNNEDYMAGLAGAYIEITDKDGDKINVVITDRLPEGKKGDIDLTRKAFKAIEPEVTGRMKITWKIIPFPTTDPISYVFKPTSSQYWAEVQVRNGRYPIKKLEYLDKNTNKYVELPRQEYNYFTASSGMGTGPYTFRVTDFYGHVLIDSGISMNSTETPVKGKANFPY